MLGALEVAMSATTEKTESEFRQSIELLLAEAEDSVGEAVRQSGRPDAPNMTADELDRYVQDLDLAISEEALITLRAQFLRFSSVFDTDQSRDVIRKSVTEVLRPLLEAWVNEHMPRIAREVITDTISQIAEFNVDR